MQAQSGRVTAFDDHPAPEFYRSQDIDPGYGYLTTRDGITLSVNVVLPGPVEEGPYPTVVEYSGYTPSDPDDSTFSTLYNSLGYAYVGVNIRGTGCSGGSFRYFEPVQSTDGYDTVEAIAAQPWVLHNAVGMVGVSYPGISQLFVAQTTPPNLAAITPLSVLDDSYRSTLYPGGLLNTGFAVEWTADRQSNAEPRGQRWAAERIDNGDTVCAENQRLRLQNPDLLAEIRANPYYDAELGDPIAPAAFVDRIDVPVFLAGAWQDEQTGGRFPVMLDRFTGTDKLFATMLNGTHTESLSLGILGRYVEFLDLYVAKKVPSLERARLVAPILAQSLTGVSGLSLPDEDRYDGLTHDEALALFEADPRVRILFEQGAADGQPAGAPLPRFEAGFDTWPLDEADLRAWYLTGEGLADEPVGGPDYAPIPLPSGASTTSYVADPDAVPDTFYEGSSGGIWAADVEYDWQENPAGTAASWRSAPVAVDTVVIGSGSVDLWISSSTGDTDVEVTITEIRPDGTEVYVQSGWLRASHRTLDAANSTNLRPVHTHLQGDVAPLPADTHTQVRVELFPVGHVFRAGSQIRVIVDAPGGNRPIWAFETIADGETVSIAHDPARPSRLVLPVVSGVDVPDGAPACGSLRGQPCRDSSAPSD